MNRLICLFLGLCLACQADTHYVRPPETCTNTTGQSPYTSWDTAATNIQWAINVARGYQDTVLVSNGNYCLTNEIVITNTGSVGPGTLISVNGRDKTFVDGNYSNTTNRCLRITAANNYTVISGFTFSNGCVTEAGSDAGGRGGGVSLQPYSILTNCVVSKCRAKGSGVFPGGVWIYGANISWLGMVDCIITGNVCESDNGGGVRFKEGGNILNCQIIGNSAQSGAGVHIYNSTLATTVDSCVIRSNHVTVQYGNGAGVYYVVDNIYRFAPITIKNCEISDNYGDIPPASGVGVYLKNGGILRNCLITRNGTSSDRGAVLIYQISTCTGYVANCTIVSNPGFWGAGLTVGGLTNDNSVFNCVIASNTPNNIDISDEAGGYGPGTSNAFWNCCAPGFTNFPPGRSNITNDPRFVNAIPGNTNNWRLANNSPCIDTGTNMSWMTNSYDLDGRARIRYGTVDMGAYEKINEATIYNFR